MTGSFPGANIAVLSACKAMDIYPVIISSVGASSWGANNINQSWIDIENKLNETDNVVKQKKGTIKRRPTNDFVNNW